MFTVYKSIFINNTISNFSGNQHTSIHDKMMAFNIIKKKIRTVLSKTDLHSGDFRHTTVSFLVEENHI